MNADFLNVLARYNARIEAEATKGAAMQPREMMARRDEFLLPVGEDAARFLHALIVARRAKRIIELGTSYGYSTLFLADAARQTGGKVTTYELAADKQAYAREQLQAAGLAAHVEWRCGDAVALLAEEPVGIDFVLVDLWKELYVPCFEALYPKLTENAVIAADNMLEPKIARPEAELYRAAVRTKPDLHTMLLPIGSGIELSCLWRRDPA